MDNSRFSSLLKELLKETKMTQRKFAKKINIDNTTICNYVNNKITPNLYNFKTIVLFFRKKGFDFSCDYWLGLSNEINNKPNIKEKRIIKKIKKKDLKADIVVINNNKVTKSKIQLEVIENNNVISFNLGDYCFAMKTQDLKEILNKC